MTPRVMAPLKASLPAMTRQIPHFSGPEEPPSHFSRNLLLVQRLWPASKCTPARWVLRIHSLINTQPSNGGDTLNGTRSACHSACVSHPELSETPIRPNSGVPELGLNMSMPDSGHVHSNCGSAPGGADATSHIPTTPHPEYSPCPGLRGGSLIAT